MTKTLEKINLIALFIAAFITVTVSTSFNTTAKAKTENFYRIEYSVVNRKEALTSFFEKYNSPLIESTETFIEVADKYNMDYRLLPAISCMESTCGKHLIPDTYNPFGWGIYGNQYIGFESYDEAIEVVGQGLAENYIAKGFETPDQIAPIYAPPNYINWAGGVKFFYNEITKTLQDS